MRLIKKLLVSLLACILALLFTSMPHQTSPALLTTLGTYLQLAALILIVIQTITLLKKRQSMLQEC